MRKIKIDETELEHFKEEDLKVDPYWLCIYDPKVPKESCPKGVKYLSN